MEGGWFSSRFLCRRRTPNRSPGFGNAPNWTLLFILGNRRHLPRRYIDDRFSKLAGSLGRLGRVINSACGHQEQEQRPLTLIFSLQAAVFPSSHNGFPGRVLNPPPPSGSAPFCKYHLEHPLIDQFRIKKIPKQDLFFCHHQTDPPPAIALGHPNSAR